MTQPARLRCNRGHYLPRHFRPHGDPQDWDDTCRCQPTHPATPHTNRRPLSVPAHSLPTRPKPGGIMTQPRTLPHDPYIEAVVDALTAAGLEPTTAETSDAESNRYDASGLTTQLDALLVWDGDHPAVDTDEHEDGIALLWEHPAEQWQWAPRGAHGVLEREPEFLPGLGLYAEPAAVAAAVWALVVGNEASEERVPDWGRADEVRAAVKAWESDES